MSSLRYFDIGANLTDPMFNGIYRGKRAHPDDLNSVIQRAKSGGLEKIIVTGGSLDESQSAVELANQDDCLLATVGCHPTRCQEFDEYSEGPSAYQNALLELANSNKAKVVAVGECGLDYDRLQFCPMEIQKRYFACHFDIAEATNLPMFLHLRNAASDFIDIMKANRKRIKGGVVHSFDGTMEEAQSLLAMDLYIGINGCSLKTEENLRCVAQIPSDRLMLETDAPWCDIRPTHASARFVSTQSSNSKKKERWSEGCQVKGRNEPSSIIQVLEVVSAIKDIPPASLAETVFSNASALFLAQKP